MNEISIKVENLCKQYKLYPSKKARLLETLFPKYQNHILFKAVEDLNLEVRKGEILGILGQNGAGKSTLLKMITGVVAPTSGSIEVNGVLSSLLELGTAFNMDLTGIENIYQHGQVCGLTNKQIEDRMDMIIHFADIGEHLNQPVKTYSSGMFARLAFACAIHIDPEILIVDEVLSVGDIRFQMRCYKKFEEFKKQGKTILFVTHNISDILKNCTRAVIMKDGRIILNGDVREVVDEYKKLMVGIDIENNNQNNNDAEKESVVQSIGSLDLGSQKKDWKSFYPDDEKNLKYGNGMATITDYGLFSSDKLTITIDNDETVTVKMKVRFNEHIDEPIFAIAVKDIKGVEVCGVNTFIYQYPTGVYQPGDEVVIRFKQQIPIAPGHYSLSFGCTKYDDMGELVVFDRNYDAIIFDVIAPRMALGILDLKPDIMIYR